MRQMAGADIYALSNILLERFDDDTMLLSELDGYLTGIMLCPEPVMPGQWLPHIWGSDGEIFTDESETEAILALVMAYYNDIGVRLEQLDRYVPRLDIDEYNGGQIWLLWASGFGKALDIVPWAWEEITAREPDDDPAAKALADLTTLAIAADAPSGGVLSEATFAKLDAEADIFIGDCVADLYAAQFGSRKAGRRGKIGRNDPCPCRSGKKYKKCCLSKAP